MSKPPDPVAAVFAEFAPALRDRLMEIRALIRRSAADTQGVGPLTETLKWGQPAYLTEHSKSGVTLRLGAVRDRPDLAGVFVTCSSRIVDRFRAEAPALDYGGDRAIHLPLDAPLPEADLSRCLKLALTYHWWKRE